MDGKRAFLTNVVTFDVARATGATDATVATVATGATACKLLFACLLVKTIPILPAPDIYI
jgi:hypothetical protein